MIVSHAKYLIVLHILFTHTTVKLHFHRKFYLKRNPENNLLTKNTYVQFGIMCFKIVKRSLAKSCNTLEI